MGPIARSRAPILLRLSFTFVLTAAIILKIDLYKPQLVLSSAFSSNFGYFSFLLTQQNFMKFLTHYQELNRKSVRKQQPRLLKNKFNVNLIVYSLLYQFISEFNVKNEHISLNKNCPCGWKQKRSPFYFSVNIQNSIIL